ncbi:MAG: preprotein translocase subunit SecE [Selenomonadaceae bacterium]|nr:preprotein translocase subunit SecE [Selenomonadaceae bacterium]
MAKATEEAKKTNPGFFGKLSQRCVGFFKGIGRFFMNMKHELKKVTWPTKQEIINYSLVVLIFIAIMTVVIGVFDSAASALVGLITRL